MGESIPSEGYGWTILVWTTLPHSRNIMIALVHSWWCQFRRSRSESLRLPHVHPKTVTMDEYSTKLNDIRRMHLKGKCLRLILMEAR
jgi:hypothetical protein